MRRPRLSRPADRHARFLELLSRQLDEPLRLDESWALAVHLGGCQRCRAAEREYREQSRRLRRLAEVPTPRDLGARVTAALDREVLRGGAARRPHRPVLWPAGAIPGRPAVVGTSAVVSLAVLTVGALAVLTGLPAALPDATRLGPTPLAVPGQPLAYLGAGPDGLAVYRTSVDRVCPASALDCVAHEERQPLLALSRPMQPSSVALSPNGERLVISARDAQSHEDVFTVVLMPGTATGTSPSAAAPLASPRFATASARTGTGTSPTTAPDAPSSPTFLGTGAPTDSGRPSDPDEQPTQPPAATPPEPTRQPASGEPAGAAPTASSSAAPAPDEATATPAPTARATADPTDRAAAPGTAPPSAPATDLSSPVSSAAALTTVSILEDVRGAGAPPAWSADGSTLAFSAMPADGSRGPDVYVWRPTDATAQPITNDHATYFASWAGNEIVASRVAGGANGRVLTVLIDPQTGAQTTVDGLSVWLPRVNGERTHAVAWYGRLEVSGSVVEPAQGGLYVFEWAPSDQPPAAESLAPVSPHPPSSSEDPSGAGEQSGAGERSGADRAGPPSLTLPPERVSAADGRVIERPQPAKSIEPAGSEGADRSADEADRRTPSPAGEDPSVALAPLEPERDLEASPVLDWEARWAPDGRALGFWIADVPGASWGRLAVLPFGSDGELGLDSPLLAPTLARRSFALGHSRVAWVGPAEATPEGELRINVWGPGGSGMLRFDAPDLRALLASF